MTLEELLALVQSRAGLKSYAQIAYRLKLSPGAVTAWTRGVCRPSEDHVLALCGLANEPPEPWFLALNQWRTKGPSQQIYRNIEAAMEQRPFPLEAAE